MGCGQRSRSWEDGDYVRPLDSRWLAWSWELIILACSNPLALGHWLYKEFLRYGVEFRMSTQAVGANLSSSNQLPSLDLASNDDKRTTIQLDDLILAAGPWTPALFKMLFPTSSIDMDPVIDAGDWIVSEPSHTINQFNSRCLSRRYRRGETGICRPE